MTIFNRYLYKDVSVQKHHSPEAIMANQYKIKSLSQCSTAEEYARRLILLSFLPILSLRDDIFETRCRHDFHLFCDSTGRRRA
ncbi:MAG: hypothetical protein KAI93_18395 [Desulfobacterales bacterium]|nr:hypothetical protein [Desulfobacterales bacterium]